MRIPGNGLEDNWYMGGDPITLHTVGEFRERVCEILAPTYKLRDADGNAITIRMGEKGVLIVSSANLTDSRPDAAAGSGTADPRVRIQD